MRRWLTFLSLIVGLAVALSGAAAVRAETLVELFTSQGCSSCPPADAYIGDLAKRDDVVALSFHVNYWDYIGWKDPFASEVTTARQREYGRRLARGRVYTPQMVIDGVFDAVGSNRGAVERAIVRARAAPRPRLDIGLARGADDGLVVSLPGAPFSGEATVWLARYDHRNVTPVRRGENAGREVRNYNVVRDLRVVGTWTGQPLEIRVPASVLTSGEGGRDGCAIIVQADGLGPVLGVRKLVLSPFPS